MLPLTNATLTQIAGGGHTEDWDRGPGADLIRWSGAADAYVTEKSTTTIITEGAKDVYPSLTEAKLTRIVVDSSVGNLVQKGDTITFTWNNQTGIQRQVDNTQTYTLFGTTRLWLRED